MPDLSRIRDAKQRSKPLPPQKSATDTSNWDSRQISAPTLVTGRSFSFILPKTPLQEINPYLLQEARKAQTRAKKTSKQPIPGNC